MSPFPLKDTTLLYTSQEGRMSQHSKISQQAESRATPLVCSSEACSLRSDSLAALINPDAGMTRETKCAGGNVQGEGKQDASICAQQMRGALALFPGSSRPRHSASACARLSGRTPKFSRKEKKEREKNRGWKQKRKEKEVSCSFLQPPSASSSFGSRAVNIPWKRRRLPSFSARSPTHPQVQECTAHLGHVVALT